MANKISITYKKIRNTKERLNYSLTQLIKLNINEKNNL